MDNIYIQGEYCGTPTEICIHKGDTVKIECLDVVSTVKIIVVGVAEVKFSVYNHSFRDYVVDVIDESIKTFQPTTIDISAMYKCWKDIDPPEIKQNVRRKMVADFVKLYKKELEKNTETKEEAKNIAYNKYFDEAYEAYFKYIQQKAEKDAKDKAYNEYDSIFKEIYEQNVNKITSKIQQQMLDSYKEENFSEWGGFKAEVYELMKE